MSSYFGSIFSERVRVVTAVDYSPPPGSTTFSAQYIYVIQMLRFTPVFGPFMTYIFPGVGKLGLVFLAGDLIAVTATTNVNG